MKKLTQEEIRQEAENNYPEYVGKRSNRTEYNHYQARYRSAFEAGANYVLSHQGDTMKSQIESIIDKMEDVMNENTKPTGGGYEADYTDKNTVLIKMRHYLSELFTIYQSEKGEKK